MKQAAIISFLTINLIIFLGLQSAPTVFAQTAPSHLKYFGYYHVACSTTTINDIPQLGRLNNSNVMMLFTINRFCLEEARKTNIKIIAWIDPYVYNRVNPQYPNRGISNLKPDWETRWIQFKEIIKGYEDVIYAFYFEEPWWLGVNQSDLWTVNQRMMSDYPNIRRMAIEAGVSMSNDPLNIPKPTNREYYKYLTDVGVDWYGADFTIFRDWNVGLYTPYLNNLLLLTSLNQRIWVVPQTFSKLDQPDFNRLTEILNQYYAIAQSNPRIGGMLNFLYSPAAVTQLGHAAKEFFDPNSSVYNEAYKNRHVQIGQAIIANNSTPTPLPTITPTRTPTPMPTATRTPTPLPSSTPKPTATVIPASPTPSCPLKSYGDANCIDGVNIVDFNIWWKTVTGQTATPTP